MEVPGKLRRSASRGTSLIEVVLALALVGAAVIVAASGLHGERELVRRAHHRDTVARTLEAALESVRGGLLPLADGSFAPPVPTDLPGLSVRIEVRPAGRPGLYRVAAVARWRDRDRRMSQRLDTMVWRP